ncbi:MAG: helix-turn-helix transcriptional regulator [Paenibacillaceae bacterium]|nr:helix-turn-helix transcriptional regulator [Paenibacillaceae bacterium]
MSFIQNVNLQQVPFRLSYRRVTDEQFPGYYHCHQGMEFIFVHRGQGHIMTGRAVHPLRPGALFYMQPFQLHRVQPEITQGSPYERTVVSFEPAVFETYFQPFSRVKDYYLHLWKNQLAEQTLDVAGEPAYLLALLQHYHETLASAPEQERLHQFGLFAVSLFQWLQTAGFGAGASDVGLPHPPRVFRHSEQIMNWIEEHYGEPFELEQIADTLHLSKHYVSRVFRQETGSSITDYITARRIRQACLLLGTSSLSVEQIGIKVGLHNFPYFCQVFKKLVGVSPNHYRKML